MSPSEYVQPVRDAKRQRSMQPRAVQTDYAEWIGRFARAHGVKVDEVINRLVELRHGLAAMDENDWLDRYGLAPPSDL